MGILMTCDKCGSVSDIAYSTLKSRKDVGRSPYGELYIPCKCGGNKFAPFRIINGQVAPQTNGFESVAQRAHKRIDVCEKNLPLKKFHQMMGGF